LAQPPVWKLTSGADTTPFGICIWEGESVDAVREVVEGAVGAWANNEYYEMHVDGLTPTLGEELWGPRVRAAILNATG
jgi:hypothetical protein